MCSEFCSPVQTRISISNPAAFFSKKRKKEHAKKTEGVLCLKKDIQLQMSTGIRNE